MLIMPAIDLYEGKAVRLKRGDYREMTVYSERPRELMDAFAEQGAKAVHVVDLEGARDGNTANLPLIRKLKQGSSLLMEVGGGIRTMETVRVYLEDAGVDRVILGTAAVTDPAFAEQAVRRWGDRIAVGVDILDGKVAIRGWTEQSSLDAFSFCRRMEEIGVTTVVVTDISRDGMLEGANRGLYEDMIGKLSSLRLIASGGVSGLEDLVALKAAGLYGAIIGKAYYTGAVDLRVAVEVAS